MPKPEQLLDANRWWRQVLRFEDKDEDLRLEDKDKDKDLWSDDKDMDLK